MQEIDHDKYGSFFPYITIESSESLSKSRLAWCYGDLGIATTLYQAGITFDRQDWVTKSLEIFRFAAVWRRDLEGNMVNDACLCHGSSGIGHIFYRMWYNTKISEFKEAADYWFEKTLELTPFTQLANITGQPAISLPIYCTQEGLPVGVQVMAAKGREDLLLQIAEIFEQEHQWNRKD